MGGPLVYILDFFEGVIVKLFRFISKQIPYLVSLNTLVLESIKISWDLIFYFSMKIKNSDHRRNPLNTFQIFSRVSKLIFFGLCMLCLIVNTSWKLIINTFLASHFDFCLVRPNVLLRGAPVKRSRSSVLEPLAYAIG